MTLSLHEWVTITATSGMPLYAVLSNVSDAQAVKNYYITDGSQTPYGLYSQTPYSNWFSLMPMLVRLEENSPFIQWAAQTPAKDWGWLARSHLPFDTICQHLSSLTQVIMPTQDTAFFRYWDGEYLSIMLNFLGDTWQDVLPAFAFYWLNGQSYVVHVPIERPVKSFPWWQVPQALVDELTQTNIKPMTSNLLLWLKENNRPLYDAFPQSVISQKIAQLAQQFNQHPADSNLTQILVTHLQQELQLASNPFDTMF